MFHAKNDKNLDFIYISREIPAETVQYYEKLLNLYEIPAYSSRIHLIKLEKPLFSAKTATLSLLCDAKALQKLRNLLGKDVCAYFLTNFCDAALVNLCVSLEIPYFCGNLCEISRIFSRETFENCGFPLRPAADFANCGEIREKREFLVINLAKLALEAPGCRKYGFFIEKPQKKLVASLQISEFYEKKRGTLAETANELLFYLQEVFY